MATIKDVAKMAGVSPSTISKYLNGGNVLDENRKAIRQAIEVLDYRANPFARNLKSQRIRSIGILLPDVTAPFYGSVITAMDKIFREHGFHTLISCYCANHGLERDNLQFMIANGIDGLIYAPEDVTADEFMELTAKCQVPTVQIDRYIQGVPADAVLVNNTDIVYQAVNRLIDKGHQRIAMICGPKYVFTAKERLVGYLKALSDNNILYDDALVIAGSHNEFANGYRGFEKLFKLPDPPTAVFTSNYNTCVGLVTAAREQGMQISEDLDIFGFDSVEICTMMKPPLPVVCQPEKEIGRVAANYMIQRLEGYRGEPRITRLDCKIVG